MGKKTVDKFSSTEAYEKLYEAVRTKGNADAAKNIKASLDDWRGLQELLRKREPSVKQIAEKWKMLQKSNARALEDLVSLIRLEKEKSDSDDSDSSSEKTSENAESSSKSSSNPDSDSSSDDSESSSESKSDSDTDSESPSTSSDDEKMKKKAKAAATRTSSGNTATSKPAVKTKAQARSDSSSPSSDSDSSSDSDAEVKTPQSVPERTTKRKKPVSSSSSSAASSSSSSSDSSDSSKSEKSSSSDSSSESSSESDSEELAPLAKRRKTEINRCLEKATSSTESKAKDSTIEKMVDVPAEQNTPSTPTTISAEESTTPPVTSTPNAAVNGKKQKQPRKSNTPFQRIKVDHVQFTDDRLKDNSFQSRRAKAGDYGEKASADLIKTRGDGFRKEKNKKKRGSYRGGEITLESHSIKFD